MSRRNIIVFYIAMSLALCCDCLNLPAGKAQEPQTPQPVTVAVAAGHRISDLDLENAVGDRLIRLKTEEYNQQLNILNTLVNCLLLQAAASDRHITLQQYVSDEITSAAKEPLDPELRAIYEVERGRYRDLSEQEALGKIADAMREQRIAGRTEEVLKSLRQQYRVDLKLTPPRLKMPVSLGPTMGPENTAVQIVEFSDFQCLYCAQAASTLRRLQALYPGRVRMVFKHYPLPIHPNASKASEAAACAGDQGRFWEMHDELFANHDRLDSERFRQLAQVLRLDVEQFDKCLNSGEKRGVWSQDVHEGNERGVSSAPTFFVNGRLLVGARSEAMFREIIDEELRMTK
jgi:protein-disulfide isomerase